MAPAVPWLTHYASPELIAAFAYGGRARTDDPHRAPAGTWCWSPGTPAGRSAFTTRPATGPTR